jgi:hypothetical protein
MIQPIIATRDRREAALRTAKRSSRMPARLPNGIDISGVVAVGTGARDALLH